VYMDLAVPGMLDREHVSGAPTVAHITVAEVVAGVEGVDVVAVSCLRSWTSRRTQPLRGRPASRPIRWYLVLPGAVRVPFIRPPSSKSLATKDAAQVQVHLLSKLLST
jgi:hypothetical protein